jgi:two-component system NtrC family sensor kinase
VIFNRNFSILSENIDENFNTNVQSAPFFRILAWPDDAGMLKRKTIPGFIRLRSTIYGRVVIMILIASLFLFVSFSVIFQSVNEEYLNTVILQNGNNIGSIVSGSLYQSMLENDKSTLQYTLDIVNTMSGIDEVNMYDNQDRLVYSSIPSDTNNNHSNPNCISCHDRLSEIFPSEGKQYRIIEKDHECRMNHNDYQHRHLMIKLPILNERSCYSSSCHAHPPKEKLLGSLIIKIPLGELDAAVAKTSAEYFILAIVVTMLLTGALIVFTRNRIKNPLNDLVKASLAVADGERNTRLEVRSGQLDDMKVVSQAFNNMLDNLQQATTELENWSQQLEYKVQKKSEELSAAQNELIHIERLASLGKLSSSVAHEINNPLSGILIYTKLIHKQLSNPELSPARRESMLKHLKLIENEAKRCGDIVKGLLEFSRQDQADFEPRHLHQILTETFELMSHPVKMANIHFYSALEAKDDLIYCSANQIKQACVAMLVNATEAVPENGEIMIRTMNPDPLSIRFEIADNGIGIPKENQQHIFEPFFSTKQGTSGIGLGLSIVHGIVQSHKGKIQVFSEPGNGATFSVTLPLVKHQEPSV